MKDRQNLIGDYVALQVDVSGKVCFEDFRGGLLSIVVPFYNEELVLKNFFRFLDGQSDKKFNLVLIDNLSTDSSLEIVKDYKYKTDYGLTVLQERLSGVARSRKTGMDWVVRRLSSVDDLSNDHFLVVSDVDVQVPSDWVMMIKKRFNETQVGILAGTHGVRVELDRVIFEKTGIKDYFNIIPELIEWSREIGLGRIKLSGPNSAFEIESYVLGGGIIQEYDEKGRLRLHEVNRLAERAVEKGVQVRGMNCRVISNKRRQLYELVNKVDSYINLNEGIVDRFGTIRELEDDLLEVALDQLVWERWKEYRMKKIKMVLRNILGEVSEQMNGYLEKNFISINAEELLNSKVR